MPINAPNAASAILPPSTTAEGRSPMKQPRTWILIADGGCARVLTSTGAKHHLAVVPGLSFAADLPASREIGTDRPGRSHESQGQARHAIEPRVDQHAELKRKFVAGVLDTLAAKHTEGAFDQLIIVAPPTVLGMIRPELKGRLREITVGEIDKDLTKTPIHEIASHLGDAVGH
jgi:protein required for attachment to host cells